MKMKIIKQSTINKTVVRLREWNTKIFNQNTNQYHTTLKSMNTSSLTEEFPNLLKTLLIHYNSTISWLNWKKILTKQTDRSFLGTWRFISRNMWVEETSSVAL